MKTSSLLAGLLPSLVVSGAVLEGIVQRQSNWTVGQTVETSSGSVSGHAARNASASEVSEYLGIPYGQSPTGDLRFAAPVRFEGSGELNGTVYGFSCPLRNSGGGGLPSPQAIDTANVTAAGISTLAVLSNSAGRYSEDCLNLNVWTKPQVGDARKAVLVWLYGGGFNSGSSGIPAYNGANLVEEQDIIVVSLNYRLSILGWPGNPNGTQNLGLLDLRLGVEWIRDNIENFGGDPSRITLFGQSAGAALIDLYSYGFAEDPIIAGIIPESGNAWGWGLPNAQARAAPFWFNVTATLDCGDATSDAEEVLSCMRTKNASEILDAVPQLSGTGSILGGFGPTADDETVFANVSGRTPARVPVLIGNTNYEAGLFRVQFALRGELLPDPFWDALNLQAFTCPTGLRANASNEDDIPVWRYRYFGVFPNLRISDEAGAWHTSEVPMLFNTAPNLPIAATPEQISIGAYMRGAWAAFAKDPTDGLTAYGWPRYNTSEDTLIRIAYENITGPNLINPRRYDADCSLVNVSSTDDTRVPDLPDAGASVTPTGTVAGATPSPSGTGTAPSGSSTSPPAGAGARFGTSVWVCVIGVGMAFLL